MEKNLPLRKGLAVGIILLFVGTCIIPAIAHNTEKPSSPTSGGHWLYIGGSGPGNYTTIQSAINDASDGDTVYVYDDSSPYYENIEVNKQINLLGESRNTTVIDGGENGDVIHVTADNVSICELNIQNSSLYPQTTGGDGILLDSCSDCTIKNNIVTDTSYGIRIPQNSHSNLVSDNIIIDNQNTGIGIWVGYFWEYSEGKNRILNNSINECWNGINVDFSSGNEITDNTIKNVVGGIILTGSEHANVLRNHAEKEIELYLSNNSIVSENRIENCPDPGIFILHSSNCTLSDNYLTKNDYGILLDNSELNTIIGNNIVDNNHGIVCRLNSNKNQMYHNNLINNSINAYDNGSNTWNHRYPSCGNFWDDYTGIDTCWGQNQDVNRSDGVGDTPVSIPGGENQDRYPLMDPYAMTRLSFGLSFGGFGINGKIKNVGNTTAFSVCWKMTLIGGFILLGRETLREIPKPLLPGEEAVVKSNMILGFGKTTLTMMFWADNAPLVSGNWSATVILFFILGIRLNFTK